MDAVGSRGCSGFGTILVVHVSNRETELLFSAYPVMMYTYEFVHRCFDDASADQTGKSILSLRCLEIVILKRL